MPRCRQVAASGRRRRRPPLLVSSPGGYPDYAPTIPLGAHRLRRWAPIGNRDGVSKSATPFVGHHGLSKHSSHQGARGRRCCGRAGGRASAEAPRAAGSAAAHVWRSGTWSAMPLRLGTEAKTGLRPVDDANRRLLGGLFGLGISRRRTCGRHPDRWPLAEGWQSPGHGCSVWRRRTAGKVNVKLCKPTPTSF